MFSGRCTRGFRILKNAQISDLLTSYLRTIINIVITDLTRTTIFTVIARLRILDELSPKPLAPDPEFLPPKTENLPLVS